MADFSEKWGTDVETAVQLALDDLKLTIDDVDVTVLEEPSRGFFGIGSKLALVRVEKKKKPEDEKEPVREEAPKREHREVREHRERREKREHRERRKEEPKEVSSAAAEMLPEEDLKPCE